ncbi:hypothetical protein HPP92_005025 [Vanilla planifolia]|uniref:Uncharacterized protein n=1 Tax=Vanilla planifolia TaxID=51239 RepID=A0A835RKX6_VANPL|nr:hypothetical protein HPP92_005025 [Vanilla planifolia]
MSLRQDMGKRREVERLRLQVVDEVFLDIRLHAMGVFSEDFFQEKVVPIRFNLQGAKHLKQKRNEYQKPRRSKRRRALTVFPEAEHVALALGN